MSESNAGTVAPDIRSVADNILEQLRLWGVKRVYGVVGDAIFGLLDALAKQEEIVFISVKHESVAALMASAEAKLTGGLGVCAAQMGPGLANLLVGLGDAYLDKVPVLALTGQAPLSKIGTSYKQFVNQQELVQSISGYSQLVVHPDAAMAGLTEAMTHSVARRTVSHLSIPSDLFRLATAVRPRQPPRMPLLSPDSEGLEQASRIMRSASRPMLLVGSGIRADPRLLTELAERWGCGIALGYGAIGKVPDAHPLLLNGLGEGGNPYLEGLFREADVVLALEPDEWPERNAPVHARVILTAGQPERFSASSPMDIGLVGDQTAIVRQLIEGLRSDNRNPAWLERIERCKRTWSDQNEREGTAAGVPLHPSTVVRTLEQAIDDDAVIALDEGDVTLWFLRHFRARRQEVLLSGRFRTMGFGLPAAMAAKLCVPRKQVVCVTGDGGLGMVLADLLTAARYELPICVIVFRNDALQMERDKMARQGLRPEGTVVANPDFVRVAEACGWLAHRIASVERLKEALPSSLCSSRPVLLDVVVAPVPYPDFPNQ